MDTTGIASKNETGRETPEKEYYRAVAEYYDEDARDFLKRYQENHVLQKIRQDFRKITEQFPFRSALEIGCGPGVDLIYFARRYPEAQIFGIDISPEMVRLARGNVQQQGLNNVRVEVGTPEDVPGLFSDQKFDMIYCYFGALNTVADLYRVVGILRQIVDENGTLVLTFVNRWYWMDVLLYSLKLRFGKALERITNRWQGYSPTKNLPSRCRSAREIKRAFGRDFKLIYRKGYSILYPAWYRQHRVVPGSRLERWLWQVDQWVNHTPFWNTGEYSLYVFQPRR